MLFFQLHKADAAARRVFARLDETVDRAGEAMDYARSAPLIKAWSDAQFAATGGKSWGNVRGQHGRVASGVVSVIAFDDTARTVEFAIDVIDDGEWEKVEKGVYTGISPGGSAVRFKDDAGNTRYAVKALDHIALVDVPCLPTATFTLLKADGSEEQIPFASAAAAQPDVDLFKALAGATTLRAYGALVAPLAADVLEKALGGVAAPGADVKASLFSAAMRREMAATGIALPDGSFPVSDQHDLEAGIAALEKAAGEFPDARAHLVARATALDLVDILPDGWAPASTLEKGLGTVSRLAELLDALTWLSRSVVNEASEEADGSSLPGRLTVWLAQGAAILTDMATEETAEAIAMLQAAVAALPAVIVAEVAEDAAGDADDMEKSLSLGGEGVTLLVKMAGDLATSRDELSKANAVAATARAEAAGMKSELARLRALPAPGGPQLRAIGRSEDVDPVVLPAKAAAMKQIEAMPPGISKAAALTRLAMSGALPASHS